MASAAAIGTALGLVFFYAPLDADQGFIQKIFYEHVPMAIVALVGFVAAGVLAAIHLRTREEVWDYRSYVAIHISVIFGVGVLATGAIWAKASWGKWWVWDEPTLVSFAAVRLAQSLVHPRVFATASGGMPGEMWLTFLVSLLGISLLYLTLVRLELSAKHA